MKRIITILIMAMSLSMLSAQEINKLALRMAVERQLSDYPKSTLQDVYKAFYQEHFGPEHMISDTAAVRNYLNHELSTMGDERGGLYYEPIGLNGYYVRVYLKAIKDGLITADELMRAFLDSAAARQESAMEWSTKWGIIIEVLDEIKLEFGSSERELLLKASKENQAVHHSKVYNETYHPHYRIVDCHIFELLLKPLIDR